MRVSNPSHSTVGPLQTVLWVRRDKNEPWREVQRWEIESLNPGRRLARDFLPSAFGLMDPAFYLDQFQLRATLAVPNQPEVAREFSWAEGEKTPREGRVQTDGTNKESPVGVVHLILFDSTPLFRNYSLAQLRVRVLIAFPSNRRPGKLRPRFGPPRNCC